MTSGPCGKKHIIFKRISRVICLSSCTMTVKRFNLDLTVENCDITSSSGRGVVAARGARVHLLNSIIHDCAATGVYAENCYLELHKCLINNNGKGPRTMSQGHSGLFVTKSNFVITSCVITNNDYSGLCVYDIDSRGVLEDTTVSKNGTIQVLETVSGSLERRGINVIA
jgi:parallel beta-helix repeat protein